MNNFNLIFVVDESVVDELLLYLYELLIGVGVLCIDDSVLFGLSW